MPRGPRFAPAAAAAILILAVSGVADHDVWTPDEPRVAALGREVSLGAWIVPTLGGEPFLEQPPLHAWCVAGFYRLFGVNPPWRARWISVVCGLLTLAAAAWLAVEVGVRGAALHAAVVLGLCGEHILTSHRVVVDGLLALLTTVSAAALLRGLRHGERSAGASRAWAWISLAHASASLAFLAKGPVGLAAPCLALVAWCLARRSLAPVRLARLWLAPPVFLAVAGPWLAALHNERGLDGLRVLLVDNFAGRIVPTSLDRSHEEGFWYYLVLLPVHLLPAAVVIAAAAWHRFRARDELAPAEARAYDFGLWWFGLGLAMLSAANTKRVIYMAPFFPAAALAGGLWVQSRLQRGGDGGAAGRVVACTLAAILIACGAALAAIRLWLPGTSLPLSAAGAAGAVAAGAAALRAARRGSFESSLAWWLVGLAAVVALACPAVLPALEKIKGLRGVCEAVARRVPAERQIYAFRPDETTIGMVPLYTGRRLRVLDDLPELWAELDDRGEIDLFVVEKRGRASEALQALATQPQELLLHDVRERSRTFKLVRVRR